MNDPDPRGCAIVAISVFSTGLWIGVASALGNILDIAIKHSDVNMIVLLSLGVGVSIGLVLVSVTLAAAVLYTMIDG